MIKKQQKRPQFLMHVLFLPVIFHEMYQNQTGRNIIFETLEFMYYEIIQQKQTTMRQQINQQFQSPFQEKQDYLLHTSLSEKVEHQSSFKADNECPLPDIQMGQQDFDYEASVVISRDDWVSISNSRQEAQIVAMHNRLISDLPMESGQQGNNRMQSKKQKNSNAIKKIGRLILDNMKQYHKMQKKNEAAVLMLRELSKKSRVGRTQVNKRDKFNTYFLRLLVQTNDKQTSSFNLKTTRKILTKNLRANILQSKQISNENKLIYLNTLKCSALRCVNEKLATRLQMSE